MGSDEDLHQNCSRCHGTQHEGETCAACNNEDGALRHQMNGELKNSSPWASWERLPEHGELSHSEDPNNACQTPYTPKPFMRNIPSTKSTKIGDLARYAAATIAN